ncbi:MAG: porin [Thalassolituus sp.]|jgi:predicted porin|nr:porin [Thalassolituus sp.]
MTRINKTRAIAVGIAVATAPSAQALDFYGEINMSRQEITEDGESFANIRSNGSAIGATEQRELNHGVSAEFLLEYEIMPDQLVASSGGNSEQDPLTLSAGYVGLMGRAGKLKIGYFATPLNILGEGVDYFTDLRGDKARYISTGDVDISNAFMYTSPQWHGLTARISQVSYETGSDDTEEAEEGRSDGASMSLSYEQGDLFAGVAYDTEVEGDDIDLVRLVVRYPLGPVALGALWEHRDVLAETDATTGWLASAEVTVNTELAVQLQYGASDNVAENSTSASLGATYDLGNDVSLYVFATDNESDEIDDESEVGMGISYVF